MPPVSKIDSNITGLSYAEEESLNVLPMTPVWIALEPNSYDNFGGEISTVARNPINASRQRRKGVITDLDASGGFATDVTRRNLQDLLQGFFFANLRRKGEAQNEIGITTLEFTFTSVDSLVTRSGSPAIDLTTQFSVGDLVFIDGANNPENRGLFAVSAVTTTTLELSVADGSGTLATLVDEGPVNTVSIVQVGFEAGSDDLGMDAGGSRPALTSTLLDFTSLGLIVGEWVFIGGDASGTAFSDSANSGFARVRSIAANRLEFDKTQSTIVTEDGTGLTIQLFFGRVLKNELAGSIVRRSYQLERTLGKADTDDPNDQAEYLVGSIPNEFTLNVTTADKLTADLSFVAQDNEQRDGTLGPKPGTRVSLPEADAFNTSSDLTRVKMSVIDPESSNPDPLFAFATDITISLNNNVSPNKAAGVLGAFDSTAGTFEVGGDITAYFANVAAVQAVRNNSDITLDMHLVKQNGGISIDLPLITLGDGRANVEQDQAITLPLTNEAATGSKIDPALDHTMLMVFWDYLPNLAD